MTQAAARPDGRTHYEAVLDARYGVRFNELNERYYNRLDLMLGLITLAGGSAAVVSWANQSPGLAAAAGVVLAFVSLFGQLLCAPRKAEQHAAGRRAYADLDARAPGLTLEQVDAELRALQAALPSGIALLAMPAYNANLRSNGRGEHVQPMNRWERLAAAIV